MNDIERYNQYIDLKWWKGIEKRTIKSWIDNFDEKETAFEILDKVIFYNQEQLDKYTECLVNQLKDKIFLKELETGGLRYVEDQLLEEKWEEYLSKTRVIPAKLETDVICSADQVAGNWRSELGESALSDIYHIEELIHSGIRRFLLVDDFAGTGQQICDILNQNIEINGQEISIGDIPRKYENIEIMTVFYVIHEKAYERLKNDYPQIGIMFIDRIGLELSYLCPENRPYETMSRENAEKLKQEIKKIQERLHQEDRKYENIKEYSLNLPIVFEHGCPNNTLLLLFAKTNAWRQLFKRGDEK